MKISVSTERWEMTMPFVTSREAITYIDTMTVCLAEDGACGRGEALGVDYLGESAGTMSSQLEDVRSELTTGVDFDEINRLLPPGGARNALDCALWDLRAKQSGKRVWNMLGIPSRPVTTVYTLSLDTPERMAAQALAHVQFPVLKLKLDQERIGERLKAIREARPDATLIIDANGAWSIPLLDSVADDLLACGVAMVEQPLPMGRDPALEGLDYPVTLCADESCQSRSDLRSIGNRYRMVNIKLDKCGGLSEAMKMVNWCRQNGLQLMVGNMLGSSLAMAPAFLVAQYCRYVDLDGPLWQKTDREAPIRYEGARMHGPETTLWG
jgi:L-alanine-DL-glutamate epimerase-like enolase superfamily enzyme